ncbi:MAG: hypothetical protein LLG45_08010 [Actinomycetia bacterium]|nr:hypothetical protein [Actinomycetes bacterium]
MILQAASDVLRLRRTEGWLVGGTVRDRELGRYSPDVDMVVADDAATVAADIAAGLRAPWFALSERHGAYRVVGREGHVDVSTLRGRDIVDDLARRDFTVNAMALPVEGGELVDPFDGLAHLREGRLVPVSERIFWDDPLRLMRAPRFVHVLGLRLDASLTGAVKGQAGLLARAAVERVATEMILTLAAGRAADAVRLWDDLGLLEVVLPEVAAQKDLGPILAVLERLDDLLVRPADWFPATAGLLVDRLARPIDGAVGRPVALRLAGLLHRLTATEAEAVASRLKLSGRMVSLVRTVAGHLSGGRTLPASAIGRPAVLFMWEAAPWEPEVILLAAARGAGQGEEYNVSATSAVLDAARSLLALWADRLLHGIPRVPLDGDLLMRELGIEGGPLLGRLLRELRLAWEAGEASSRDGLLAVAKAARAVLATE